MADRRGIQWRKSLAGPGRPSVTARPGRGSRWLPLVAAALALGLRRHRGADHHLVGRKQLSAGGRDAHPLLETGQCKLDGAPVAYLVMGNGPEHVSVFLMSRLALARFPGFAARLGVEDGGVNCRVPVGRFFGRGTGSVVACAVGPPRQTSSKSPLAALDPIQEARRMNCMPTSDDDILLSAGAAYRRLADPLSTLDRRQEMIALDEPRLLLHARWLAAVATVC